MNKLTNQDAFMFAVCSGALALAALVFLTEALACDIHKGNLVSYGQAGFLGCASVTSAVIALRTFWKNRIKPAK